VKGWELEMRGIFGVVLLGLCACTSTLTRDPVSAPQIKLERGGKIALATPANGSYSGREYVGSGADTAMAAKAAFAKYATEVEVVASCRVVSCLREAAPSAKYFIVPEILHWEDRSTEWSGKKDRLEVKISVFDATNDKELASSLLSGKSKWMTFGGDHPQDLLPTLIGGYADTLY